MSAHIDLDTFFALPEPDQEAIKAWLNEHGIDPDETRDFTVGRRRVHATVYALNEQGRRYVDGAGMEAVTERVTKPIQSRFPITLPMT